MLSRAPVPVTSAVPAAPGCASVAALLPMLSTVDAVAVPVNLNVPPALITSDPKLPALLPTTKLVPPTWNLPPWLTINAPLAPALFPTASNVPFAMNEPPFPMVAVPAPLLPMIALPLAMIVPVLTDTVP